MDTLPDDIQAYIIELVQHMNTSVLGLSCNNFYNKCGDSCPLRVIKYLNNKILIKTVIRPVYWDKNSLKVFKKILN